MNVKTPFKNMAVVARVLLNPKRLPLGAAITDTAKTALSALSRKDD